MKARALESIRLSITSTLACSVWFPRVKGRMLTSLLPAFMKKSRTSSTVSGMIVFSFRRIRTLTPRLLASRRVRANTSPGLSAVRF